MAKLDEKLAAILVKYDQNPKKAVWDCHGNWIAYHWACEEIARSAGITFDPPMIVEADSGNGVASICVTGHMGDAKEWSIGEAAPKNNKNAYPWAMAEKRGKDRVILKLIGLHGLVYSEEEADDFKKENQKGHMPTMKSFNKEALEDFPSQELSPEIDGTPNWELWDTTMRNLISEAPDLGRLTMLWTDNKQHLDDYASLFKVAYEALKSQFTARKGAF